MSTGDQPIQRRSGRLRSGGTGPSIA